MTTSAIIRNIQIKLEVLRIPPLNQIFKDYFFLNYEIKINLVASRVQQYCFPDSPQQYLASSGKLLSGQRNDPNLVPFISSLFTHVSPTKLQTKSINLY